MWEKKQQTLCEPRGTTMKLSATFVDMTRLLLNLFSVDNSIISYPAPSLSQTLDLRCRMWLVSARFYGNWETNVESWATHSLGFQPWGSLASYIEWLWHWLWYHLLFISFKNNFYSPAFITSASGHSVTLIVAEKPQKLGKGREWQREIRDSSVTIIKHSEMEKIKLLAYRSTITFI